MPGDDKEPGGHLMDTNRKQHEGVVRRAVLELDVKECKKH